MLTILLIVLIVLALSGGWVYGSPYRYYGGGLGLVLLIVLIIILVRGV